VSASLLCGLTEIENFVRSQDRKFEVKNQQTKIKRVSGLRLLTLGPTPFSLEMQDCLKCSSCSFYTVSM